MSRYYNEDRQELKGHKIVQDAILAFVLVIVAGIAGCPPYNVWKTKLEGKAELMRQEQTRLIIVEQAKAEEQSAQHRANAIGIIGEAAKKYPEYRQQEFIGAFAEAMSNGDIEKIIYVPTEAGIPITEAGRIVAE